MKKWLQILVVALAAASSGCGSSECAGGEDPAGLPCEAGSDCNRRCICENGEEITVGECHNKACVTVTTSCTEQCALYGYGGFTGNYCAP